MHLHRYSVTNVGVGRGYRNGTFRSCTEVCPCGKTRYRSWRQEDLIRKGYGAMFLPEVSTEATPPAPPPRV